MFVSADNNLNEFVFNALRSKITKNAQTYILCRPDLNTWPQIRNALREQFGDRIDRQTLTKENILDYINRVKSSKSRLEVKIKSDPNVTQERKLNLIEQNEGNALDVLMGNVNDSLRTILDMQNPRNMNHACETINRYYYREQRLNSLYQDNKNTNLNQNRHNNNYSNYLPQKQYYPRYNQYVNQRYDNKQNYQSPNYQTHNVQNEQTFPRESINIHQRQIPPKTYYNQQNKRPNKKMYFLQEIRINQQDLLNQ
ncbi:glycosyltransferase-like protein gnt13 [Diabrotica virgifera virgifera]|uniref:Uncharacterized protein n=1 Tax=Diabrotica virgifera virgifera TaxID=50390 RepID=A0ABM5K4Z3_DIAVI|nr:glycosyltransferase-like protein gnt13 [Diabrotica virgifera virgifera]